jgi:DNA repair protein RecO
VQSFDDEALVLDTYPYSDRHLIVSVLTHRHGVHRGVLRRARGGKAPAAAIAQVLTRVRLGLAYRPQAELGDIRHFDLVTSSFPLCDDLTRSTAAAVVAELLTTFCPAGEPAERSFRLGVACLEGLLQGTNPAAVVAYAQFWTLNLGGVLPPHESITAAIGEASRVLAIYRSQPVGAVSSPSPETARWLDQRVREEAERPLRALGFFRSLDR